MKTMVVIAFLLIPGSLIAQADPRPEAPPPAQPVPLDEVRIEYQAGALSGTTEGRPLWRLGLMTADQAEDKQPRIHGPVRAGDAVFICLDTALLEVDARSGRVRRRLLLPGSCTGLAPADGGEVRVTAGSDEPPGWTASWRLGPQHGTIPYFAFGQGGPGLGLFDRIQARRVVLSDERGTRLTEAAKPATRAAMEAAVAELEQLEGLDRTNPWYAYFRAEYLELLGRKDEAAAAYQAVLGFEPTADCQLVGLAAKLDRVDPGLADNAWRRGMACLLARGHEPELVTSLLATMVTLGKPEPEHLNPADDGQWAILVRRAERLADLSPGPEGSAAFWTAMAQAASKRGLAELERRFRRLAELAGPSTILAPMGPGVRYLGYWLNGLLALILILLTGLAIKLLRTLSARFSGQPGLLRKLNPLTRWQAGELIGLVLGAPVLLWLLHRVAVGVIIIGSAAAMPLSMGSGNLGHPAVVAWLDDMDPPATEANGLPAGARFIKALALQQAGQLDRAEALYRGLPQPEAKANLGALLVAKGDRPAAERLWTEALALEPTQAEAAHNLGRPAASIRTERAVRYGLQIPMLAMPTVPMWDELWQAEARRSAGGLLDPFQLAQIGDGLASGGGEASVWTAMIYLIMAAAALALLALICRFGQPALDPPAWGKLGWGLGWLLPGGARQYGPLWPAAGGLFLFVLMGAAIMSGSGGQASNLLDAVARPAFDRYYGLTAAVHDPTRALLDSLASWTWVAILFGAHLVYLVAMEKLRPDPAGPFGRREA